MLNIERLSRKPWCAHLDKRMRVRPRNQAIGYEYIQLDLPTARCSIVLDIDRGEEPTFWNTTECSLPPPNRIVQDPETSRLHYQADLAIPVRRSGKLLKPKALFWLDNLQREMIRISGADAHVGHVVTKNPLHPHWLVYEFKKEPYELDELASWIDIPRTEWWKRKSADAIKTAEGRNCDLFDEVRHYAYSTVNEWRANRHREAFLAHILNHTESLNVALFGSHPFGRLPPHEVRSIAKSVGNWTWERYHGNRNIRRGVMAASFAPEMTLQDKQIASAIRSSKANAASSKQTVEVTIANMKALGKKITKTAVAKASGLSRPTVIAHWPSQN